MNQYKKEAQVAKSLEVSKKKLRLYQDKVIDRLCVINLYKYIKDHKSNNHNNLLWHINNRRYKEVNDTPDEYRNRIFIKYYLLYKLLYKMTKQSEIKNIEPIYLFILQQLQFIYDINGTFDTMIRKEDLTNNMEKYVDVKTYFYNNLKEVILDYPNNNKFIKFSYLSELIKKFTIWYSEIDLIQNLQDLIKSTDGMFNIIKEYSTVLKKPECTLRPYIPLDNLNKSKMDLYNDPNTNNANIVLLTKEPFKISESLNIKKEMYLAKYSLKGRLKINLEQDFIPIDIKFDKLDTINENLPSYRLKFQFPIEELTKLEKSTIIHNYSVSILTDYKVNIDTNEVHYHYKDLLHFKFN